jgi:hypothetical protein
MLSLRESFIIPSLAVRKESNSVLLYYIAHKPFREVEHFYLPALSLGEREKQSFLSTYRT